MFTSRLTKAEQRLIREQSALVAGGVSWLRIAIIALAVVLGMLLAADAVTRAASEGVMLIAWR